MSKKLIYLPNNSRYWVYDSVVRSVRFCRSTRTASKSEARKIAEAVRSAVINGECRGPHKHMTLREAAHRYWDEHGEGTKSARGFVWPKLCLLVDRLGADTRLDQITNDMVSRYVAERRRQPGRGGATKWAMINGDLNVLRAVLRRARDHWDVDIGKEPNWRVHKRKAEAGRERYLAAEEQERLLQHLPTDIANMLVFSVITGVRLRSAIDLQWSDIYDGHLVLRDLKSGREGERRTIPLTPELRVFLQTLRGQHPEHVFSYECSRGRRSPGHPVRVRGRRAIRSHP
jgi:integrase